MYFRKIFLIAILFLLMVDIQAQVSARLFRYPDVSSSHITFSYGGDIWIVPIGGGIATKLSSPAGSEIAPKFSPDGSLIAFSGNYDGNVDIYVIPAMGGLPERVTHHGMGDRIQDWYPNGEFLLYTSSMNSGKQRFSQFYRLDKDGGLPEKLPMAYGEFGSLNADATKIAFTDKSRIFRNWKRYRGGMAADIFIFDLKTMESENITNHEANDEMPMWYEDKIYYLSDKGPEKRYNIWYYDTAKKENVQVTEFSDFDIHMPSVGPGNMVFEAGGKMYIMDLENYEPKEVLIEVTSDMVSIKPHKVDAAEYIENINIAPDGNRAIVEARGEIFSLPAEKGVVRNLTRSSATAERYPAWSPNGRYIAYWSDKSGEYELNLRDQKEGNTEKQVTKLGPGFRYNLYWSPDSKKLVYVDQTMTIQMVDAESGMVEKIDRDISLFEGGLQGFHVDWSPDSRWIAYDKSLDNGNSAIFIYDTKEKNARQVTSGFYSDHSGAFDPDGKYLFITTNRNFDPVYSDFDNSWVYPNATGLAAIALRDDVPSPLAPENDTVTIETDDEPEAKEDKDKEEKNDSTDKEEDEDIQIDFDGFERRLIMLPPTPGNMGQVAAVAGKVIYQRFPNSGSDGEQGSIMLYDLKDQEEKTIMSGVRGYRLSANGKKLLVAQSPSSIGIVDVAPDQKLENKLALNEMELSVDPREEWKQIFNDAWRFERDFFYDKSMHGVDWTGLRTQYGNLIQYAMNRDDVNFIIGELIAELNASHTYRGGGDQESPEHKSVGYLGVDWAVDQGQFKVKHIVRGADWDNEVRSPLDMPGVDVSEGDFILAVNGVPLNDYSDPWGAFEGLAGKTVELTVNSKPVFDGARTVVVETMRDETRLRNLAWIEENRRKVDEASGGKIGYIYVPSTGLDGQEELVRQFYGQWNKDGLIVDERFNNGGQIPDRFIELLNRKPLAYWSVRDGKNWQWPPVAHFGTMAMLANGWSGSGGDAFPDYFQKAGLGPVIGTRTWGGLIGISGSPSLIDGGSVTVPTFRMYNPDGTWFKEGYGVDPDIEVKEDPTQLAKGNDTQLQAAIEYVMEQIKKKGPIHPPAPGKEKRS
ncbi:MAG: PD40 domain-containing protein [Saprospiraceae bacterium]|nr:PD40 domain-containing protein [Saprospiraceae bacterium]